MISRLLRGNSTTIIFSVPKIITMVVIMMKRERSIVRAKAPREMFSANGALNRRCFVVPSMQLVVTRLGDNPRDGQVFDRQFWRLLIEAAPAESRP